jgi:hypothetical protein
MKVINYLIILFFISCAANPQNLINSKIREARYLLTEGKCSDAIEVLDEIKSDAEDDPDFIKTYASALACRAKYSELKLFSRDLSGLDADSLFGSLASFSTSTDTEADSDKYTYIMEAIDYILYAPDVDEPSTVDRIEEFGERHGGDLSMQALYMIMVNLGKFMAYYGNADTDGLKGQGGQSNTCLFNYTDFTAVTYVSTSGLTGSCTNAGQGHPDLNTATPGVTAAIRNRRLCDGIILYNNMMDILANISLASNESLGDMSDIQSALAALELVATTVDTTDTIDPIFDFYSHEECEDFANTSVTPIERFYAIFIESLFESTP